MIYKSWISSSVSPYWRVSISHKIAITHHPCSHSPWCWAALARSPPKRRLHDLGFQAQKSTECIGFFTKHQVISGATWTTGVNHTSENPPQQGRNSQIAPAGPAPEPLAQPPRGSLHDGKNFKIFIYTHYLPRMIETLSLSIPWCLAILLFPATLGKTPM